MTLLTYLLRCMCHDYRVIGSNLCVSDLCETPLFPFVWRLIAVCSSLDLPAKKEGLQNLT